MDIYPLEMVFDRHFIIHKSDHPLLRHAAMTGSPKNKTIHYWAMVLQAF